MSIYEGSCGLPQNFPLFQRDIGPKSCIQLPILLKCCPSIKKGHLADHVCQTEVECITFQKLVVENRLFVCISHKARLPNLSFKVVCGDHIIQAAGALRTESALDALMTQNKQAKQAAAVKTFLGMTVYFRLFL